MLHPDQKYIDALVKNDKALITELYERFSGKMKWLVLQNHGNATDAADIFQEVLFSIYGNARNEAFILTCPLETFLYLTCKNRWMSELHKRKSGKVTIKFSRGYNMDADAFKLAGEFTLKLERKNLLTEKLGELCGDCRKLLQLSWRGKPMMEVARKLDITYGYARKTKSECMSLLIGLVKRSVPFISLKW